MPCRNFRIVEQMPKSDDVEHAHPAHGIDRYLAHRRGGMCSSSRVTHHALSCSSIRTTRSQRCYYCIQLNLEALSFPLEELGELTTNATRSPSQKALCLLVVRSRRSQIPDHQARYVVHKVSCFPIREDVWATQDCRVCQRLHYRH